MTYASALSLPDFGPVATWYGTMRFQETGAGLAVTDLEEDGVVEIAVGQPSGHPTPDEVGTVYLLSGTAATGSISDRALLEFRSPGWTLAGTDVKFGALVPEVPVALLTCGGGYGRDPAKVYAFDPATRGIVGEEAALRILKGPAASFGWRLASWDLDLDGQEDLVVAAGSGIDYFLGPWVSAATDDDRDGRWGRTRRSRTSGHGSRRWGT